MSPKKGRKALDAGRNAPPQVTQRPIEFVIAGTVTDENISVTKDIINEASATATMRTVHGRSLIANEQGATLMQSMEDRFQNLEAQVAKIRGDNQELRGDNQELRGDNQSIKVQVEEIKEDNRKLGDLRNMYLNVRERAYLTFLQDHCAGYKETNKDKIKTLNQSVVHGGDALADASMFLERRPVDAQEEEQRLFRRIYGLHAEKIKELDRDGYKIIIQVLDAVGLAHLQGTMALKRDQERIFNKTVELIQEGKAKEAERVASDFPFETGYIPLDPFRESA